MGFGPLFALVGMAWGIQMSIAQDFPLAPAHAHHNLIGLVVMTIYGFYYRLVPVAASKRLAVVHFWIALIGAVTFGPGIAMATLGQGEVLVQIAEGLSNKEIASRLGVGVRTVETHRERIMRKLDIHSVAGLTKFAIARGLVSLRT